MLLSLSSQKNKKWKTIINTKGTLDTIILHNYCFIGRDRFTVIKHFIPVHVRDVTSMEVVRFES